MGYRKLPEFFYRDVEPAQVERASVAALNLSLAQSFGLTQDWLRSEGGLAVLSGQAALSGEPPLAMAYGGHQFGHWSGMLGDGRARLVGDVKGRQGLSHELHLKGSGTTPFSRRGDGKATLGSALREYIVSEAMAALGVPTTRALSVITTGESIMRNGPEPGAILCRSARSHIRVGTFQLAAASGEAANVKALADFSIERLYSDGPDTPDTGSERYLYFLRRVIAGQAALAAKWMGFGFIHGVMNTDNTLISGETIDYGPCAFMDEFHPAKVFSSIDRNGRYAWKRQGEMAHWNIVRLAESLLPLLGETEDAQLANGQAEIESFSAVFEAEFNAGMARKLGVAQTSFDGSDFLEKTFAAMTEGRVDFTLFFRRLTLLAQENGANGAGEEELLSLFETRDIGANWLKDWRAVTGKDKDVDAGLGAQTLKAMAQANPIIIPRNHRVEEAIVAANSGDYTVFEKLLEAVTQPFKDSAASAHFETPPSDDQIVRETFCGT